MGLGRGDVGGYRLTIRDPGREEMKIITPGEMETGRSDKTYGVMEGIGIRKRKVSIYLILFQRRFAYLHGFFIFLQQGNSFL